MKKPSWAVMAAGLIIAVLISNAGAVIRDGRKLDELRGSVLRLHILANSDSERDQELKLAVRDELLGSGIFGSASCLEEAEAAAAASLDIIEARSEKVLRSLGCNDTVTAELENTDFDERIYGDMTMPAGRYRALRIKIGKAEGHNWWCVLYPQLCLPAVCAEQSGDSEEEDSISEDDKAAEEHFDKKELDMLKHPKKYRVRFAIWDKIKSFMKDDVVQDDENKKAA